MHAYINVNICYSYFSGTQMHISYLCMYGLTSLSAYKHIYDIHMYV